jgi:predicted nucleic acid-binding protein
VPPLTPKSQDHIDAAELRNRRRRADLQAGAVDALLAQLCIRHKLTLLTTDNDFVQAALLSAASMETGSVAHFWRKYFRQEAAATEHDDVLTA